VGRNGPYYGRTGEPLAVPTSPYPYGRRPCGDSGELVIEYSLRLYVTVRNRIARLTHAQSTSNAQIIVRMAVRRTRCRGVTLRYQIHVDGLVFRLVVEKHREAGERSPVQVEVTVVAPISSFAVLVLLSMPPRSPTTSVPTLRSTHSSKIAFERVCKKCVRRPVRTRSRRVAS